MYSTVNVLATVVVLIAFGATASSQELKVLMLGDSGFHKPSGFFRTIEEPLKKSGIDLKYTENLSDISGDTLKGFAGLLIFANLERITPEAEKALLETRSDASGPVSDPNGEPYTWIRESGKGRVFYTAWGHDTRTWSNVDFQQLLSRGIRWACHAPLTAAVTAPTGIDADEISKTTSDSIAVPQANRQFTIPEMMKPSIDEKRFTFVDVGAKIPNYTPGRQWGTQATPLTEM